MTKKKTTAQFIAEAKDVHGDFYDYSKVEYKGNKQKVKITCPIHGEFEQVAYHHLAGCGCQECYDDRRGNTRRSTVQRFIKAAKRVHGDKYDYSRVNYKNSKEQVEIVCPQHGVFLQSPNMHLRGNGCPICRNYARRKLLYDVAFYDVPTSMTHSKEYIISSRYWHSMLRRCYAESSLKRQPTYKDCYVCGEWLLFSNFKEWWNEHYVEGWCLDKDILVKGNKEYAPDKCCFVPNEINILFCHKTKMSTLPCGVKRSKYGFAAVARIYGKDKYLGTFKTPEEAFNAYKVAKEAWIKEVADKWKDKLDPKVYEALYNYEVEITD